MPMPRVRTMLVSEGLAAMRATLIWVACAATRTMAMDRPELRLRAMSASVFLLNWGL